jgi:nicotinamidase-related amidase
VLGPASPRANLARGLRALLAKERVDSLTITALATEYCVKETALDAPRDGST